MPTLSVVIVAQDEERTIGQVLAAIKPLANEIVLVDSGSTDGTIAIATEYGALVYHQEWLGYGAQKNFAIDLATSEWILSLDADEVVTPELAEELKTLFCMAEQPEIVKTVLPTSNLNAFDGYRIPRLLFIGATPVRHGGFYPDAQLRLFRKGAGKFNERLVHEAMRVNGRVGELRGALYHYAYRDVAGFAQAMEKYARLSAKEFRLSGKKGGWRGNPINEVIHPLWTFFYRFIIRGGFCDGSLGWKLNSIYSDYVRRKIRYFRESE